MNTFIKTTTIITALALFACATIVLSDESSAAEVDETESGNVAQIGQMQYATLEDAIQASQSETEITLLDDVTVSSSITIGDGKHITIDLSGHILNLDAIYALIVDGDDAYLQITNSSEEGKLFGTAADNDYNIAVNHGTFELQDVLFESKTLWAGGGCIMIVVTGSETDQGDDYSKVIIGPDAEMLYTGTITDPDFGVDGIYIQNCKKASDGDTVTQLDMSYGAVVDFAGKFSAGDGIQVNTGINVQGIIKQTEGSIPKVIVREGAVIEEQAGLGIYGAGYAQYTIEGGEISGVTGVEIRSGSFTMTGGKITGTADETITTPQGSAWTTTGAGLSIAQHTTKLPISVTIEGGTIEGCTAVKQSNPQNNDAESVAHISMSIEDGTFTSTSEDPGAVAVASENLAGFISGGSFTGAVDDDLVDPAYSIDQNTGEAVPDKTKYVAHIRDRYYASLSEAIAEAVDNDTIYLDTSTEITSTIYVRSDVTIDLCENTLTMNVSGAGDGIYFMSNSTKICNGKVIQVNPSDANLACGLIAYTGELTIENIEMTISKTTATSSFGAMTFAGATLNITGSSIVYVGEGSPNVMGVRVQASTDEPDTSPTTALNMSNVTIDVPGAGVMGNGTECNTVIEISSSSITSDVLGIYHPQNGKLTVRDTKISGQTGIEMRDGTLKVYGDSEISGSGELATNANGNGSSVSGVGMAISQYDSGREIVVSIHDGTFNGDYGVYECALMSTSDAAKVDITIEGGTFNGTTAAVLFNSFERMDGTKITGGTFSSDVTDYLAEGLETITDSEGNTVVVTPDLLTVEEISVLSGAFRLPLGVDASLITAVLPDGFTMDGNGLITIGDNVSSDIYQIQVTLVSTGLTETLLCSYESGIFEYGSEVPLIITDSESTQSLVYSKLDGIEDLPADAIPITFDVSRVDGQDGGVPFTVELSDLIQDFEIMILHFVGDSVDYPDFTVSGGSITISPDSFSPFCILLYTPEVEPGPDYPITNPGTDDDDYVPLPPQIVYDKPEGTDNTTTIVACAAAALVAALMAVFLIIERRRS